MRGFASVAGGVLLAVLALPFLALSAWGVLFGAPTVAVLAFAVAWLLLPLFNKVKPVRLLKFAISFMVIPAALALAPMTIGEVNRRVEELSRLDRTNPAAFSFADKAGIYGLNIVMGLVAYPLYPEASRETLLMMFPAGAGNRRVFLSGFGLGSDKLRGRLRQFVQSLPRDDEASIRTYGPVPVEWDWSEYKLTSPEARYGLALNQTMLYATAARSGNHWRLHVRHEVEIRYPTDAYVTLVGWPRLRVQEGLFWVLQQCGWLHPYTAEWWFTIDSDDPRLAS
jgi:hypothetical protein